MPVSFFLFCFFAVLAIAAALGLVFLRRPVLCVMCLLGAFAGLAGEFFLLDAAFLGVVLLLVQAGAMAVVFAFCMMLFGAGRSAADEPSRRAVVLGMLGIVVIGGLAAWGLAASELPDTDAVGREAPVLASAGKGAEAGDGGAVFASGAKAFGSRMLGRHMLPLQLGGLLLLVAVVGVTVLCGSGGKAEDGGRA